MPPFINPSTHASVRVLSHQAANKIVQGVSSTPPLSTAGSTVSYSFNNRRWYRSPTTPHLDCSLIVPCIHTSTMHPFVHSLMYPSSREFIHPCIHLFKRPTVHPSIHKRTHPSVHPSVHPTIHPCKTLSSAPPLCTAGGETNYGNTNWSYCIFPASLSVHSERPPPAHHSSPTAVTSYIQTFIHPLTGVEHSSCIVLSTPIPFIACGEASCVNKLALAQLVLC